MNEKKLEPTKRLKVFSGIQPSGTLTIANYLGADGTQCPWMIPTGVSGWTFEPTDVPNLGEPFDRTQVNQDYQDVLSGSGSTNNQLKETMAAHIQIGYLAVMERAFRERHRLMPRAFGLAQGRGLAHGDSTDGVHIGSVKQHVLDIEGIS